MSTSSCLLFTLSLLISFALLASAEGDAWFLLNDNSSQVEFEIPKLNSGDSNMQTLPALPMNFPGSVGVTFTEIGSIVEICFNQFYFASPPLSTNCPTQGYLYVNDSKFEKEFSSYSDFVTPAQHVSLIGGYDYYITIVADGDAEAFNMTVDFYNQSCPEGEVGVSTNEPTCVAYQDFETNKTYTISDLELQYILYNVPANPQSIEFVLTIVSNSSTKGAVPYDGLQVLARQGGAPYETGMSFTYDSSTGEYTLQLPGALSGDYYVSVNNTQEFIVGYSLELFAPTCGTSEYGPDCAKATDLTDVQATQTVTNSSAAVQYFMIYTQDLVFGVAVSNATDMAPPAYSTFLGTPSDGYYIVEAKGSATNLLRASAPSPVNWIVAVAPAQGNDYYYWANLDCPNDCQGANYTFNTTTHGTCDSSTGVCACSDDYKNNIFCAKESGGLGAGWIVLIVLGCALIIALVVGVPIACYVKNKTRARYERV